MRRSIVHILNGLILMLYGLGAYAAFDHLPDQIPKHFDLSGQPDAYAAKSAFQWFMLFGVAIGLVALLYGCAWAIGRYPRTLNMPNQAKYNALSSNEKAKIAALVRNMLYGMTTMLLVLFATLQAGSYQVAMGTATSLPQYVLIVLGIVIISSVLSVPFLIVLLNRCVDQLAESAH